MENLMFTWRFYSRDRSADLRIFLAPGRPYRLAVRTPPFHGGGTGSIPVRVATIFLFVLLDFAHAVGWNAAVPHSFSRFSKNCAQDLYNRETVRL